MMAANVPMNKLEGTVTNPAAGVMATSPTTEPIQNPTAEGFLPRAASNKTQARPAAAAAVLVTAKAEAAKVPALKALPALKPNQPNQSSPVPSNTKGMLAGEIVVFFSDLSLKYIEAAKAAKPADMCTTVPPAKSRTPHLKRNPSGCQVQCANGAYINREKSTRNKTYDLNLMRSANVPVMRAGVMIANFNWKKAKSTNGIVGASDQGLPSSTF